MDPRATSILPQCRNLIGEVVHRPVRCDARQEYPKQDHRWYAKQQQEFEAAGCRLLGDYRYVGSTPSATDHMRCFVRALVSPDSFTGVVLYRAHPPLWQKIVLFFIPGVKQVRKVRDCESFVSDGTSVTTSIVSPSSVLDTPPHESRRFLPARISSAELLEEHRRHVAEWCAKEAGRSLLPLHTVEDFYNFDFAMQQRTQRYRKGHGGMTVAEIARIARCSEMEAQAIQRDIIAGLQAG